VFGWESQKRTQPTGEHSRQRRGSPLWKKSGQNTIGGNTMLSQDFKEFLQSLNDSQVRYLVIGGYAVALHGYPRYTKDLDVWIEMAPENADRIIQALEQFGFGLLGLKREDFLVEDQIIQLGYPPNQIDIINSAPGVNFSKCYDHRVILDIDGVTVNFIDIENLRKNKKASGRAQDLADLENLEPS
jgi:predicted nucleotidyltransferase